jgi:hypothetical protein
MPLPVTSTSTKATESAQQAADIACRKAAPHDFFNAAPTTIGDIRAGTSGLPVAPRSRPYASLLRNQPPGAFAAWCWRQPSPDRFVSYIVGPHGEVVPINAEHIGGQPSPGPPIHN